MKVTQIYEILNTITQETLGESVVVQEDLSNVVDLGNEFLNSIGVDNYVRTLVDHIGRVVFVDRVYNGRVPSVLMDGWEYGSILEKVSADLPQATENESLELEDGTSYDTNVFYKPSVSVKFYNSKVTFEIPISITDRQVKSSFDSATQVNAFFSMIYTAIRNSMTLKLDSLIMRTINVAIAETLYNENTDADYTSTGIRAVNLLNLYNAQSGTTALTAQQAIKNPDFLRFSAYTMGVYKDRLATMSTMFNIGGKERFTPEDRLHTVMLSEFYRGMTTYLQNASGQYKNVDVPTAETVAFWQGSGTNYGFDSTSKISVKTANNNTVTTTGVLCVMFDRDALGVCNRDPRTTSNYNPKAEFTNFWHKEDGMYFVDTNENIVVFYVA